MEEAMESESSDHDSNEETEECEIYSVVPLHLKFGFNEGCFSDRVLHIKMPGESSVPQKSLYVNSLILAAQSGYFRQLFTSSENAKEVKLTAADQSEALALHQLLEFMYSGELPATDGLQLLKLLLASNKFGVAACSSKCLEKLVLGEMSLELACAVIHSLPGDSESMAAVINMAVQYHLQNLCSCFTSGESLAPVSTSIMEFVLRDDNFRVSSEYDAFKMLISWVVEKFKLPSEQQKALDLLLPHIRFQLMSTKELEEIHNREDEEPDYDFTPFLMEALFRSRDSFGRQKPRCLKSSWRIMEVFEPRYHIQVMLQITRADLDALEFSCSFALDGRKIELKLWSGDSGKKYLIVHAPRAEYDVHFLRRVSVFKRRRNVELGAFPKVYAFELSHNTWGAQSMINIMKIVKG